MQGREVLCGRARPLFRIGRSPDNDLVIDDDFASRRHSEIAYRNGRFHVTDHSSNGTLLVRPGGRGLHIQGETLLLEGQGTLRFGHVRGGSIDFVVEIVSEDGKAWTVEDVAVDPVPVSADLMRCEGEYWTVAYDGQVLRLKDSKGLRYLAAIMRRPGREVLALDLASSDAVRPSVPSHDEGELRDIGHLDVGAGAGPQLDATARKAYAGRIRELQEELAEADRLHDAGRVDAVRAEQEFLEEQLASAVGLGGRDRDVGANAERARVAVTLRIKSAIQKIRNCHPSLGTHLAMTVKTGRYCSYEPDPKHVVAWIFD